MLEIGAIRRAASPAGRLFAPPEPSHAALLTLDCGQGTSSTGPFGHLATSIGAASDKMAGTAVTVSTM
jgi:hypothetical protein